MAEKTQIGREVIGQYTPIQQQEVTFLGLQIMDAIGLDTDNPQHVEEAINIIQDCITRGLKAKNKVWFLPEESVAPVFEEGVLQRQRIVSRITAELDRPGTIILYAKEDEIDLIKRVAKSGPFAPNLEEGEEVLTQIDKRKKAVAAFQNLLFRNPTLKSEADELRNLAISQSQQTGDNQDESEIENRLFANLLLNMAVYNKVAVSVDPRDLALLSELWKDPQTAAGAIQRISREIQSIVIKFDMDGESVGIYVQGTLEKIENYAGNLNFEKLRDLAVTDFIFQPEDLATVEKDFENPPAQPIEVTPEQLNSAVEKAKKIRGMQKAFNEDEDPSEESAEEIMTEFAALSPFELVYAIHHFQKVGASVTDTQDLKEFPSFETYVNVLNYAGSAGITVTQTGGFIEGLDGESLKIKIKPFVESKIISDLREGRGSIPDFSAKIPPQLLIDFIQTGAVSEDQRIQLLNLDDEIWVSLCRQDGMELRSYSNDISLDNLAVSEVDILFPYLEEMPEEKVKNILRSLQRTIEF